MECIWCGWDAPARLQTIEHLMPQSRGGTSSAQNCAHACNGCNSRRGSQPPLTFIRNRARATGIVPDVSRVVDALTVLEQSSNSAEQSYGTQQKSLLNDWIEQVNQWGSYAM